MEAYYANGKFDFKRTVEKIENRVTAGEKIPDDHLRAYRIGFEEVLGSWLPFVGKVIEHYFINIGRIVNKERLSNMNSRNSFRGGCPGRC